MIPPPRFYISHNKSEPVPLPTGSQRVKLFAGH
ncbi:hypothetical protein [Pseudomonas phage ANB1]|nr:hypothetical protein [Pseudomonas phage ANB1]